MNHIKELVKRESPPNRLAKLAVKLCVTESYVRMIANGTSPGWRLGRDIEALYNKETKND